MSEEKNEGLEYFREDASGTQMTTNQGLRISDDENSLRGGERGPSLLEDHILREKITHFDHERIPERVVHARGVAAHGVFQAYPDNAMEAFTQAKFLLDPSRKTPVFVRFSTVAPSQTRSPIHTPATAQSPPGCPAWTSTVPPPATSASA